MLHKTKNLTISLLEYFSRILKVDLKYIFKGGSLLTITQISSAFFGFLMTLVFANYLPQEEFGIYKYILATYALLSILSLPGIDTALIDTISKGNTGAFKNAIFIKMKWGLIGSLASICYAIYNFITGENQLGYAFILISFFLPFMESFSIYSSFYNGKKKYLEWTITELLNQIVSTAALFLTMYSTHNIYILISVYFLTYISLRFLITLYILKSNTFTEDYNKEYISYGRTMSWYQIITRGINTVDQMIIFNIVGAVALAVFSIANAIPVRTQSFVRISGTLAFPKFSNYPEKVILETLPRKMFYFGLALFFASCAYALIAPTLFKYFLPKYLDSVGYSQVLMFYIISGMTYPFGTYLVIFKKVKEQYAMAFLNIFFKLSCLAIFVPILGVWGAVIGVLVSSYSTIFATYFIIWREKRKLSV